MNGLANKTNKLNGGYTACRAYTIGLSYERREDQKRRIRSTDTYNRIAKGTKPKKEKKITTKIRSKCYGIKSK